MVEVFVESGGKRTFILGSPFNNVKDAHDGLYDFAVQMYGSYKNMINNVDAYGFIIQGVGEVKMPTKA